MVRHLWRLSHAVQLGQGAKFALVEGTLGVLVLVLLDAVLGMSLGLSVVGAIAAMIVLYLALAKD